MFILYTILYYTLFILPLIFPFSEHTHTLLLTVVMMNECINVRRQTEQAFCVLFPKYFSLPTSLSKIS